MHRNVVHCRDEYNKALARFYACRHLSKMNEVNIKVIRVEFIAIVA